MIRTRILCLLSAVLGTWLAADTVLAQRFQPFGPLDFHDGDWQLFGPAYDTEPVIVDDPNTGFFVAYDRVHASVSRPLSASQPNEMDKTWGNRLTLGYMTEEDHGWLLEFLEIDGPNYPNNTLNFGPPLTITIPYIENSLDYTSVELSKQWRVKQLHHGSFVDLFLGVRYGHLLSQDTLVRPLGFATPTSLATENHMVGPQVGLRWFKQKGRWTISSEGRYYYAWNDQFLSAPEFNRQSQAGGGPGIKSPAFERWVQAGDVRAEVTFDVTKACALNAGLDVLYMANGVGRGFPPANDQDLLMVMWTFGFSFNR